jgi:hypothetical protein
VSVAVLLDVGMSSSRSSVSDRPNSEHVRKLARRATARRPYRFSSSFNADSMHGSSSALPVTVVPLN